MNRSRATFRTDPCACLRSIEQMRRCCCRDLRDAALDEASRTKSELRQLRQQHEELLLSSREAASRADVANSQLMGELKLKGFELARLQVGQFPFLALPG